MTAPLDLAHIRALRALLAAATPGPWKIRETPRIAGKLILGRKNRDDDLYVLAGEISEPLSEEDAALIVASVNALPVLLDRLDAADAALMAADRLEMFATRARANLGYDWPPIIDEPFGNALEVYRAERAKAQP